MAASWGCFDLQRQEFLYEALKHAGVDTSYLPEVRKGHFLIGKTRDGVPVMGSIGDNQASLFGSVRDLEDTVLLNVGTGSQISFVSEEFVECGGSVELRPCTESSYILVGASLCGGRAYAMLEQFYREVSRTDSGAKMYSRMQEQAEDFIEKKLAPAYPENDGKQTPMKNHPVFIAQHACACCCRGCLEKWYKVPKGRELTKAQQEKIVNLLMAWIKKEYNSYKNR